MAAAVKLREMVLEREDGAYLGSQDDLTNLLGVGRVTLQQTARILEQERLLRVRRGVNGGYYGTRPDEAGVEQAVAVYLRAKKAGFAKILPISTALSTEMLRLAALSEDEESRGELCSLRKLFEDHVEGESNVGELERAFFDCVFRLAANPVGEVMLRVIRTFWDNAPRRLLPAPDSRQFWRLTRLKMIAAILERDAEYVQILSRRFGARLQNDLSTTVALHRKAAAARTDELTE